MENRLESAWGKGKREGEREARWGQKGNTDDRSTDAGTRVQSHMARGEGYPFPPLLLWQLPGPLEELVSGSSWRDCVPQPKSAGKIGPHWGGLELRRSLPIKCLPFLSPVGQRGFKQHLVCAPHNRAVVVFPWEALDSSVMYHFTSAFPPSLPHFLLSLLLAAPRLHSQVEHCHKSFALGSEF